MDGDLERAVALHRGGNLAAAEPLYRALIEAAPGNLAPRHLLGVLRHQQGRHSEAERLIAGALAIVPDWPAALLNHASVLQALGRPAEALAACERAVALQPGDATAWQRRGDALFALDRLEEAVASYDRALRLNPTAAEVFNNRGTALSGIGRSAEALDSYDRALLLRPDWPEALYNRATALFALGRDEEAIADCDRALGLRPGWADALINRGRALARLGRDAEALASHEAALAIDPDCVIALMNRSAALAKLERYAEALVSLDEAQALDPERAELPWGRAQLLVRFERFEEALAAYDRVLDLQPDQIDALIGRAMVLLNLRRHAEAEADCRKAVSLSPQSGNARACLGLSLEAQLQPDAATGHYEAALALEPGLAWLRLRLCTAQLPPLYREEAEIELRRDAYRVRLEALRRALDEEPDQTGFLAAVGANQPFYLPYQGRNDRDLQRRYGELACRASAAVYPPAPAPEPPGPQDKVRLGIVSGFFRGQTVWNLLTRGWVEQLDRGKFRLFLYHTVGARDAATDAAASAADRFVQGPLSTAGWREAILADRPHVLIYPEIGMDAMSARLAAQRLAPVQCVAWGHPNTTGYPTLDYFLSSDLMEPPDAAEHYTERLVRLPNLSLYYDPLPLRPVDIGRAELGLRADATAYWCGQSLYKYLPHYDRVFARIAAGAGNCQFVFFEYFYGPEGTALFRERLARAFAEYGLEASDHCVVLPRVDIHRFAAIIAACDVVLDSIGWSGGNTTMESLAHCRPIVTWPGPLMRGRHTAAILEMLGVTDTVARSLDDYVAIAIRLAHDPQWRQELQSRMAANRDRVYRDRTPIAALEDFLGRVARGQHPPPAL